ncbi:hypothetical protein BDW59DRAFT_167915 [Aspergillus cavernicola]|uniref:Uncharacterized protein n=1 Tax=Aspergillus cavernicola TaxID=176166 RepID=A0ABR4H903_9EURO
MNWLCLSFEMVYTLQPHMVVHWEHTRVMMMFLRCLAFMYGGQGHHLRQSTGLWVDCQLRPLLEGSDVEQVQEGMGIGDTLAQYGYGWFLDKLDYWTMIFRPPHCIYLVFNTPSLLSQYYAWYRDLTRGDLPRAAVLLDLLVDLCLRAFRQEVFRVLDQAGVKQPLRWSGLRAAQQGKMPLTAIGFRQVLGRVLLETEFQYISSMNAKVNEIGVLRKNWEHKAYWLLFRQYFEVITQIFGLRQAREWRVILQYQFICMHWLLLYPSVNVFWSRVSGLSRTGGQKLLQIWVSVYPYMAAYYRDHPPVHGVIPVAELDQLPVTGWHWSTRPSKLHIMLLVIPGDPSTLFSTTCMTGPQAAMPQAGLPFLIICVVPSMITQSVLGYNLQCQYLARHLRPRADRRHDDQGWLIHGLLVFSEKVLFKFQYQARQVCRPAGSEGEALTLRVDVPVAVEDLEKDSNTENLSIQ